MAREQLGLQVPPSDARDFVGSPRRAEPLTPEQRVISRETSELFWARLVRNHPWTLKNGVIRMVDESPIHGVGKQTITAEDLSREKIPHDLGVAIDIAKQVEDYLTDYTNTAGKLYRPYKGLDDGYKQWGGEEVWHANVQGLILEAVGFKTPDQIADDFEKRRENVWQPPFTTPRQGTIYTTIQEPDTGSYYGILVIQLIQAGAPHAAAVIDLVRHDEQYHGGAGIAFAGVWAKHDPKGFYEDLLNVSENYYFPAQEFFLEPLKTLRSIRRVGALSRDRTVDVILKVSGIYEQKGMIPEGGAKAAASAYLNRKKPRSYTA